MKKLTVSLLVSSALSVFLTGCLQPTAHSIGATLMPAPLDHRVDGSSTESELSVSASGFWGHTSEDDNLQDLNAGGGNLSVTYRLGGSLSPLFVNAAVGGFGGSLKFACTEDDCDSKSEMKGYNQWLSTEAGGDSYNFWNVQERVLLGADFRPVPFLIAGLAGGVQFYQGDSDYDDAREALDGRKLVDNVDDKAGLAFTSVVWLGTALGSRGEYGNIVAEFSLLHKGTMDDWTQSTKWTYSHPTGFFGGLASGSLMSLTLFAGKTFVF